MVVGLDSARAELCSANGRGARSHTSSRPTFHTYKNAGGAGPDAQKG